MYYTGYVNVTKRMTYHPLNGCGYGHVTHVTVFWRPIVQRFALCYRTVACPVLSVTLVYCGQTVGWIRIPFGVEVGLDAVHIVLDGDPAPPTEHGPQFSASCGQTAGWIKMPLGTEVGLGQGDMIGT